MVRRTPRHFRGTQSPGKKLSDLLPEVLAEISKRSDNQHREIFRVWGNLLGEKMASLTEPVSFVDGTLTVKVKSATLYSLLSSSEKPRLLRELQKKFPVRNLLFRVG